MSKYRITVFGGAQPKPGDATYNQALRLGKLLGEAGFTVLTGGYMGTMEGVSRGAAESGAHVIGVTCDQIEAWRDAKCNPWVIEEVRCKTLRERIFMLIDSCDAALALPGGAGTLTEIAMFWNELIIHVSKPRPLIAIGEEWETVFTTFFSVMEAYTPSHVCQWLTCVPNEEDAIKVLNKHFSM